MNNYVKIYWLTRLDAINNALEIVTTILFVSILLIIFFIISSKDLDSVHSDEENVNRKLIREKWRRTIKYIAIILIISSLGNIFIPTQKQAIMILAGGKTMDFIQSDSSINKLPRQTTLLVSEFFEQQIKQLNETDNSRHRK